MYDIFFIGNNEQSFLKLRARFPTAKQIPIVTDVFESFTAAKQKSFTRMFWVVWDDLEILPSFNFDLKVPSWDEQYTHVFLNDTDYDGIALFSKKSTVTKKELTCRFFINKKETGICASTPRPYDVFNVSSYEDYLKARELTTTDMLWLVFDDLIVVDSFKFDMYFSHHNQYDRQTNHVFLNDTWYDGIILTPKQITISKKEFDHRFLVNKKEWDIVASRPKLYDVFYISTYKQYLEAIETTTTDMLWLVFDDLIVADSFKFDMCFSHHNQYDRRINHMFKNGNYYDGIILASVHDVIPERAFEYRFLPNKKEWDIVASQPKPFDIVFISYFEKSADDNFQNLLDRAGNTHNIYRINGVKGIHNAHRAAAELAKTDMFWVVDADAIIKDGFEFNHQVARFDTNAKRTVYVWRSINPINDLEYGYGGVKLLPKDMTLKMDLSTPDMTTSISSSFKAMDEVSNVTAFNTDEFSAWRSAFRECVKLSSRVIDRQNDEETMSRMAAWLEYHPDKPFSSEASFGAFDGIKYGRENAADPAALALINDFDWLKNYYQQIRLPSEKFQ